ncbi:hypothetical protein PR003_g16973 [Phytophthora rubi]|uniref:Endonuclease III homolog n=1 Tax=Phytophthora rubi TaxID=129364 RepID=A0A6A4EJ67_9STRA|nr:hypothetical protein PR003_g16973 [Phytophthora rubi]
MRLRSSGPIYVDASLESKPVVVKVEVERESAPLRPSRRVKTEESVGVKREKVEKVEGHAAPKKKTRRAIEAKKRAPRREPSNWREILKGIEEMRANKDAEVDKYGCEVFFDESFPPHVSLPRAHSGDDEQSNERPGLTIESMLEIDQQELAQLIRPVGFFNHKAKYIKQTAEILTKQAEVEGRDIVDIPNTYEGLVALPGVGPKMSTLVMNCAWNNTVGICVDTHVHRISNRLKWVKTWNKNNPKSQNPEKTRAELEDWLPKEHWGPINPLLVGFGQTICLPRGPRCNECKIRGICPSANSSAI